MGKVVSVFVAEVASVFLFQNVGIDKGDIPDLAKVSEGGKGKVRSSWAVFGKSVLSDCCLVPEAMHEVSRQPVLVFCRIACGFLCVVFFYALEPCKKPPRPHNLLRCNTNGSC